MKRILYLMSVILTCSVVCMDQANSNTSISISENSTDSFEFVKKYMAMILGQISDIRLIAKWKPNLIEAINNNKQLSNVNLNDSQLTRDLVHMFVTRFKCSSESAALALDTGGATVYKNVNKDLLRLWHKNSESDDMRWLMEDNIDVLFKTNEGYNHIMKIIIDESKLSSTDKSNNEGLTDELVAYLLQLGLDINYVDTSTNNSAVSYAIIHKKKNIVGMLLAKGVTSTVLNAPFLSANRLVNCIQEALYQKLYEIVPSLIKAGAEIIPSGTQFNGGPVTAEIVDSYLCGTYGDSVLKEVPELLKTAEDELKKRDMH